MANEKQPDRYTMMVQAALAKGVSRRTLLRRGLALGLGLPSINAILAACGTAVTAVEAPPTTPVPPTATPVPPTTTPVPPTATPVPPTATPVPPSPTPVPPTVFAVIGDFGFAGEPAAAVAELVHSWEPEFVVTAGDNNYPTGKPELLDRNVGQYYHRYIYGYEGEYGEGSPDRQRFFPALGNHDWDQGYPQAYLDYFKLPGNGRYYTFTWGPLSFFILDSMFTEPDGYQVDSIQAAWLEEVMSASTSPWNIVVCHHPPYSSGLHAAMSWMRWPYREWGADLVISGHDHNYERIEVDGLTYVVNGLGGGARYAPGTRPEPGSQVFYNADHGAMRCSATAEQLFCQFINRNGDVIDEFEVA
jgi:tartrate-resistant acid phosphatase type 5